MMSFESSLTAFKSQFFDRDAVLDAVRAAERRKLQRAASYVRTAAKRSFRRSGRPVPGSSPVSRTGKLRGSILYFYDQRRSEAYVGPFRFQRTPSPPAPKLLEKGGVSHRGVRYDKFPYMMPALRRSLPYIRRLFAQGGGT